MPPRQAFDPFPGSSQAKQPAAEFPDELAKPSPKNTSTHTRTQSLQKIAKHPTCPSKARSTFAISASANLSVAGFPRPLKTERSQRNSRTCVSCLRARVCMSSCVSCVRVLARVQLDLWLSCADVVVSMPSMWACLRHGPGAIYHKTRLRHAPAAMYNKMRFDHRKGGRRQRVPCRATHASKRKV